MDFGTYNLLVYASLRGLPVAIIVRFIMRPRRRGGANLPKALAGGILGLYACWHVGIAAAGKETWNPMLSLIPVAVAEFAAYLSTVLELKQECVARKPASKLPKKQISRPRIPSSFTAPSIRLVRPNESR